MHRSFYTDTLRELIARAGYLGTDPRHIEGYLRLEFGTLDALSREQITAQLPELIATIHYDPRAAETLAQSFGL